MIEKRIEGSSQLGAVEIAGNLQRVVERLRTPEQDPGRLHHQLLRAQGEVVAALVDLNGIIGAPAPLPAPRR